MAELGSNPCFFRTADSSSRIRLMAESSLSSPYKNISMSLAGAILLEHGQLVTDLVTADVAGVLEVSL